METVGPPLEFQINFLGSEQVLAALYITVVSNPLVG